MKRSPELRDLSEQHHYALVAARQLRLASEGKADLAQVVAAFQAQWEDEIRPHFKVEEEVLLPELAARSDVGKPLFTRTLAEHAALREAVQNLRGAPPEDQAALAAEVGRLLHDHVRFEERMLYPAVEAALTAEALAALGTRLTRAMPRGPDACRRSR